MNRPSKRIALLAVCFLVSISAPARAQTGAATLTGIVTDQNAAAVPGVSVTATNQATRVDYRAVTNSAGSYTITSVPIGRYIVQTEMTGFKSKATNEIVLEANQTARLDFALDVGDVKEQVEVVATTPVLQTETATVGTIVSGTTAVNLPLNGRNSGALSLLSAGVITPNPTSFTTPSKAFSGGRPYVNGMREQGNNFTLDGVDMNESIDNLVPYQPSPDALAQISVETNNYAAELGNVSGAVVNNVVKSGTNELRGNVFEFLRNSSMDANTWVNNRTGAVKADRTQHTFGGTVGGPLVTNKVFFFFDYQGTRLDEGGGTTASVAPASWRAGNFSALTNVTIRDPLTGQPFPNNTIPANRISPVARALLADTNFYPLPTTGTDTNVSNNYAGRRLALTRNHQWDTKMDVNLSEKDRLFGRYSWNNYNQHDDQVVMKNRNGGATDAPYRSVALNWNRIITPTIVNEVLFGWTSTGVVNGSADINGIGSANATYGIGGGQAVPGLSQVTPGSGLSDLGGAQSLSDTLARTYQFNEKITLIKGRHVLKAGGQWLHFNQRRFYAGNNGALGLFAYTGAFTGFAFADFLLDDLARKGKGSAASESSPWTQLQNRIGIFAQDDIKVTNNLTLNAGFRWEYTSPLVEKDDRQTNFDLTTGQQLFAGQNGNSRALYDAYYKGFEPRIGFAWTKNNRWVTRGAYGIVQHLEGTGANLRLPMNPPFFFESEVVYDATSGPGNAASGFTGLVALDKPSGQVRAYMTDFRPQFTQQWNVFVEYLLSPGMSVNVGYVGNKAEHMATARDGNQPLPGTGPVSTWLPVNQRRPLYAGAPLLTSISTTSSIGNSNYNGLQTSVRQRLKNGMEFIAAYTWSKTLSDSLGYYGAGSSIYNTAVVNAGSAYAQNAYDQGNEYGPAFFDATHLLSLNGSYELPFGKGRRWGSSWGGITNALAGGWQLAGIYSYHSGFPVTVIDSRKPSNQASRGNERPIRVGDGQLSDPTIDRWIDISAFTAAPAGTFGDSGIGILRAPNYNNVDAVLSKRFAVDDRRFATFKLEVFNLFNHPSFGPPARDIADPANFGRITSTINSPRILELAFKFDF